MESLFTIQQLNYTILWHSYMEWITTEKLLHFTTDWCFCLVYLLILCSRLAAMLASSHYVWLLLFRSFFFFFLCHLISEFVQLIVTKLATCWMVSQIYTNGQKFGAITHKFGTQKHQNFCDYHKYLWSATRYRKMESGAANCSHSHTCIPDRCLIWWSLVYKERKIGQEF